ncbi:MAG: MarR family transcriptional regulator [Actinobacteria bacterium]|nr:MarR family transcriptional regulator [Actinomycetota bacterium]
MRQRTEKAEVNMTRKGSERGGRAGRSEGGRRELAALALWTELTCLTGTVRQALARRLEGELGILSEEAALLVELAASPEERLRMADVSRRLAMSKSGATRLVDRMAERGLVVRAACPQDRRVVYAGLTDEGRRTAAAAAPVVAAGVAEQLAGDLSADELVTLAASLRALRDREGLASTSRTPSPRS